MNVTGVFALGVAVVLACAIVFEAVEYHRRKRFQQHLRNWAQTYIDQMSREETGDKQ